MLLFVVLKTVKLKRKVRKENPNLPKKNKFGCVQRIARVKTISVPFK